MTPGGQQVVEEPEVVEELEVGDEEYLEDHGGTGGSDDQGRGGDPEGCGGAGAKEDRGIEGK